MVLSVKRVTYKEYAGIVVNDFQRPVTTEGFDFNKHIDRAAYVAMKLEAPFWGGVQGYDNAGLSGGPFHWIARFPKTGGQGPLFGLLKHIETVAPGTTEPFTKLLYDRNWFIAQDGMLRDRKSGGLITGNEFRDVCAPTRGLVPETGPERQQAERWAIALHNVLVNSMTYRAQVSYAIKYLCTTQGKAECEVYSAILNRVVITPEVILETELDALTSCAMSVYHAHSVNAPAPALQCLQAAYKDVGETKKMSTDQAHKFSDSLIKRLALKKFGNWEQRYVRTRKAILEAKLWPNAGVYLPEKFK